MPNDFGLIIEQPEYHDPNEAVPVQDRPWFTDEFDVSHAWSLAWELNNTGGAIGRMMAEGNNFDHDPDFDIRERFDELSEDVPSEHWERLAEARNEAHAFYIKSRIDEEMAQKEELMKMGTGAYIGSTLLQGVTDPGALALSISTGGFAAIAKAKRLSTAIKAGLITGAENMALETVLSQSNKTSDASDVLWAGAAGVALGGTFGAVMAKPGTALDEIRPDIQEAAQRHLYDIEDANLREAKGETADDLPDTELVKEIREAEQTAIHAEIQEELDINQPRSVGAAEADYQTMNTFEVDVPQDILDIPKLSPVAEKADFGLNAQLMRDENPYIRWIGYTMSENSAGHKNHAVGAVAASERAEMVLKNTEAEFARGVYTEIGPWAKANGKHNATLHPEVREEFMARVSDQIEGHIDDPLVAKTADAMRSALKRVQQMAAKAGVRGFDKFKASPNYLPRIANPDAWRTAFARYSEHQVKLLIRKGIKSAQPGLDDELIGRMAEGYTKNVGLRSYGVGARSFDIGTDNRELLKELLEEMDLDESDVKNILTTVMGQADKSDAGLHARAKHRTLMDINVSSEVVDRGSKTGERQTLRLADLFERDAERLLSTYSRTVGGAAAIAQRTRDSSRHITSRADFDRLLDEARKWEAHNTRKGRANALGGKTMVEEKIGKADIIYNRTTGVPLHDQATGINRARRLLMQWNFTRLMGKVAFSQFAEFGNMLSYAGLKEVMQQVPEIGKFMKRLRETGELNHKQAAEWEAVIALGTDALRSHGNRLWDNGERVLGLNKVEESVHLAQQAVAAPMHAFTALQQRMTVLSVSQRLMNMATGSRKITKGDRNRLNHLGLDKKMRKRVFKQMRQHVTTKNGKLVKGAKVRSMNFDKWSDQEAAQSLQYAVFRMSRRIIQENDIGATTSWMNTPLGQVIAQFRTFTLVSHSKQLLNGLHNRDFQTGMAFLTSVMFASMGYALRTYTSSLGREDREEYLKEKLSVSAIARAGFAQSSWSALMPMAVDTGLDYTGQDPLFSFRSTGLSQSLAEGIPLVNGLTGISKVVPDIADSVVADKDYSGSKFRNVKSLIPTNNLPGVEQFLNAIGTKITQ